MSVRERCQASGNVERGSDPGGQYAKNSRRFPIIVIQQTAETGPGFDRSFGYPDVFIRLNDLAVDALMIPLAVVVSHEFLDGLAKMPLSQRNDLVETF